MGAHLWPLIQSLQSQVWLVPHFAGSSSSLVTFSCMSQGLSLPPLLHCALLFREYHSHPHLLLCGVCCCHPSLRQGAFPTTIVPLTAKDHAVVLSSRLFTQYIKAMKFLTICFNYYKIKLMVFFFFSTSTSFLCKANMQ